MGGGTGSATGDPAVPVPGEVGADTLNVGDKVRVIFSDTSQPIPLIEQQIPDSGKLTLHLNQVFDFAGQRRDVLERAIQEHYINKGFYKTIVVTIEVPPRPISVGGEVRAPGNYTHQGQMTVLKAIDAAGGFTEYADRRKVRVTRLGTAKQILVNCKSALENPSQDIPVYPGDKIYVRRSFL